MSMEPIGLERIVQEEIRKKVADRLIADALSDIENTLRSRVTDMLKELEVVSLYKVSDAMSMRDELRIILKLKDNE